MKIKIGSFVVSNEPARFGLTQAEAALKFAKDPVQVGAVLGVVVGVLGYQNAVAADVATATAGAAASIDANKATITSHEDEIESLKREIASLQGQVKASTTRQAQLAEIAKLFGAK